MKKNVFLSIILLICFLFSIENVYADVDIIPRTEENLLVPDSVVVDDSNRDIILKTPAVDATKKIFNSLKDIFIIVIISWINNEKNINFY